MDVNAELELGVPRSNLLPAVAGARGYAEEIRSISPLDKARGEHSNAIAATLTPAAYPTSGTPAA
jgi:hypothetical protein